MMQAYEFKNCFELFERLKNIPENDVLIKYMKGKDVVEVYKDDFWEDIKATSSALIRLGLQGKHVGIIGKNSYHWFVSYCALMNVGSVAVLFNKDYSIEEINKLAVYTDLSAIIFDEEREKVTTQAVMGLDIVTIHMQISHNSNNISLEIEKKKKPVVITNNSKRDDLACIIFTSGTTGENKAVMLSNKSLLMIFFYDPGLENVRSTLVVLPFHHLAGFSCAMNNMCFKRCVCIGEDIKRIFQYISCMHVENFSAVPAILSVAEQRLRKAKDGERPLGDVKVISCGGAKFQPDVLNTFLKSNIKIIQAYAASETGGLGLSCEMTLNTMHTLGKPSAQIEADIQDGELVLRGDSIMMGYYKNREATEEVIKDGWYHTGDLCRRDEDGYYYYLGRKKNLIILSNGENVSPEEIENKLQICNDSKEVLIKEENDFICGEFYPNYPENATEEEIEIIRQRIIAFVENYNSNVPTYKQVKIIKFRECAFEKTPMGKIVRYQ